jgi:hypothetical protein
VNARSAHTRRAQVRCRGDAVPDETGIRHRAGTTGPAAWLPNRHQSAELFGFMAGKPDALLVPVFPPLLGRIHHAAEDLILALLKSTVPSDPSLHDEFFKAGSKFLSERCRFLRRMLVPRSPIMPTGVVLFCLEYARNDKSAPPGIPDAVKEQLARRSDFQS